jgi:hypothetical protein
MAGARSLQPIFESDPAGRGSPLGRKLLASHFRGISTACSLSVLAAFHQAKPRSAASNHATSCRAARPLLTRSKIVQLARLRARREAVVATSQRGAAQRRPTTMMRGRGFRANQREPERPRASLRAMWRDRQEGPEPSALARRSRKHRTPSRRANKSARLCTPPCLRIRASGLSNRLRPSALAGSGASRCRSTRARPPRRRYRSGAGDWCDTPARTEARLAGASRSCPRGCDSAGFCIDPAPGAGTRPSTADR